MSHWSGKRVTLMGLGRHGGGVGAARWLAEQGAVLTITDLVDEGQLAASLAAIADLPVERFCLGRHVEEDFATADVVVVNPAIAPSNPFLAIARQCGARIVTEIELLLSHAPARAIGVTGSNGKTTTSDMLRAILEADGRRVWLGGNIGGSLLADLPRMRRDDWLVLELSSFQLHYLSQQAPGPRVAVITNCTANHLDWHGDFTDYAGAKQRLLTLQPADSVSVLNTAATELATWHPLVRGRLATPYPDNLIPPLATPGLHQRQNAACAAAAARSIGCSDRAIQHALQNYRNLPHRMALVSNESNRRFYDDSKATTPEATIAALTSTEPPLWLLAGGHAKGGDYASMVAAIARYARGAALFGAAGAMFRDLLRQEQPDFPCVVADRLDEAFAWCLKQSAVGDAIVLSPGCASFDQYRDYVERAERFVSLVSTLHASGGGARDS